MLISHEVIFQGLKKGMPGGPPCGISNLIVDIFDQQTQPNDRQPPSNLLSSPKTSRIFDFVAVVFEDEAGPVSSCESAADLVFVPEQVADLVFVPEQLADPVRLPEQVVSEIIKHLLTQPLYGSPMPRMLIGL